MSYNYVPMKVCVIHNQYVLLAKLVIKNRNQLTLLEDSLPSSSARTGLRTSHTDSPCLCVFEDCSVMLLVEAARF